MKKKRVSIYLLVIMIFLFPISYAAIKTHVNFDNLSAVIFLILLLILVFRYKKKLDFQHMLKLFNIPIMYAVLWRTKFGLKFMDKFSEKYRELIKLLGYIFIGLGFVGMIFISINVLMLLFSIFSAPEQVSKSVSLVLPLTNIPGLGYLSFWHFLITIFITVLIHEFAHGIVARAHNIPVKSSGLGVFSIFLPLFPLAFVEPDEKVLEKSPDVVQYSIFSAGPIINIIFAFLIFILSLYVINPIEENITNPVGFTFSGTIENYSAAVVGLEPGMIITEINGVETLTFQEFQKTGTLRPDEELEIVTKDGTFTILTKPSPDDPSVGYIGISGITNERRIKDEYKSFDTLYFWIKDLIKWMLTLNFIVGLMNLLPLMITDGGRMLKTALERIINDKGKANKLWAYIGTIFIFTLLASLVLRYTFPLFSSLGLG